MVEEKGVIKDSKIRYFNKFNLALMSRSVSGIATD
jgi:hypothetical protein